MSFLMCQGWQRFIIDGTACSYRMGCHVSLAITVGIGVALTGCSYGSRVEAVIACEKWEEEGPLYRHREMRFSNDGGPFWGGITESATRSCDIEDATRQVLGWEGKPPKGLEHTYKNNRMSDWDFVVKKRFRW